MDVKDFNQQAQARAKENKKFLKQLKSQKSRALDNTFHELHEEVFNDMDCLVCANCCKTTSPIFINADIERLAKRMRIKPGDFIQKYLKVDSEGDYVLQSAPCSFLGQDNYCSVYEDRPRACREYPHTNRKKMTQILDLTYNNSLVCPAVLEILERLKRMM